MSRCPVQGSSRYSLSYVCGGWMFLATLSSCLQFSLRVVKYDRHGYKARTKAVIITDTVGNSNTHSPSPHTPPTPPPYTHAHCPHIRSSHTHHPPHTPLHRLDTSNFKVKEQFPLSDISAISVSSLSDGVVVIGLPTEGPNARGDLIIKTEQVIELVTKLALFGGKLDTVKIVSTGT